MIRQFIALCSLLLACSLATAEVYKWVDENGKVRFSDKAPQDKKAEDIAQKLEKTNIDEGGKNYVSGNEAAVKDSTKKTADEELLVLKKRQELERRIGKRCREWIEEIKTIARGDLVAFYDENGNEIEVLERDRGKKLQEWKDGYQQSGCEELYPLEQQ